jgi:hypothetical protein
MSPFLCASMYRCDICGWHWQNPKLEVLYEKIAEHKTLCPQHLPEPRIARERRRNNKGGMI